jgi:hypothetical protein
VEHVPVHASNLEAKDKIYREAVVELATAKDESMNAARTEEATSDDDEDNLPIVALVKKAPRKKSAKPSWVYEPILSTVSQSPYWDTLGLDSVSALLVSEAKSTSDDEDDLVPLASLVAKEKLDILAAVSTEAASIVYPVGEAAIGVEVARDFGGKHGICCGKITKVDLTTRQNIQCTQDVLGAPYGYLAPEKSPS